ncbi:MAG: general secretion pathway protein GspK [Deltaproteobacteria bacterium]|nr:general secretion pathway protein GspK [Deltaproteobacteria bacterium]
MPWSLPAAGRSPLRRLAARGHALLRREVVPARHRRGAALVVVLLTIAILTTVIIDFVYQTRVQLHMAVNQRDEVRAYFLARSGMDLARLALGFQRQVSQLGAGINIQIWQYLNQFMGAFNAGRVDLPVASVDLSSVKGLGQIKGAFDVDIEPQDGKINLGSLAVPPTDQGGARARLETIARLTVLMSPGEHKELFEQKDGQGQYNDIPEIIAALIDWVDVDADLTTMSGDGVYLPTGPGQEANRYRKVGAKVKPRNMKPDTLLELHRVKGIGDDFFSRFGESLTIYPTSKINVNTANEQMLAVLICSYVRNPMDPLCNDPFLLELSALVLQVRMYQQLRRGIFMMTPFQTVSQFSGFLRSGKPEWGFQVSKPPDLNWAELEKAIEVRPPAIYQIKAEGRIANTTKTLVAVIDLNKKGKLYYWREF